MPSLLSHMLWWVVMLGGVNHWGSLRTLGGGPATLPLEGEHREKQNWPPRSHISSFSSYAHLLSTCCVPPTGAVSRARLVHPRLLVCFASRPCVAN